MISVAAVGRRAFVALRRWSVKARVLYFVTCPLFATLPRLADRFRDPHHADPVLDHAPTPADELRHRICRRATAAKCRWPVWRLAPMASSVPGVCLSWRRHAVIEAASLPLGQRYGLEGACVVVTGAAGAIGRALASAFQAQGVRLVITDRDAAALHDFAQRLAHFGPLQALDCDLGDDAAVAAFAAQLTLSHGAVDVLVNSAGSDRQAPLDDAAPGAAAPCSPLPHDDADRMARLTRALLPLMTDGASVINQPPVWGQAGGADFSACVASRHAVIGLTRSLARELAPRGIRVNAVCPGWVRTDAAMRSLQGMAARQGRTEAEIEREILSRQALPVLLKPADIAGVYLFLASADARSLTGQSLAPGHGELMN